MKAFFFMPLLCTWFCPSHHGFTVPYSESVYVQLSYKELNEQGIKLFSNAEYLECLESFSLVTQDYYHGKVSEIDYGTALWEQILCNAALENLDAMYEDSQLIRWFFLEKHKCSCNALNTSVNQVQPDKCPIMLTAGSNYEWFERPQGQKAPDTPAKFADPNERISIQDCIDRVKGTAVVLKGATLVLKRKEVIWTLQNLISEIERAGV